MCAVLYPALSHLELVWMNESLVLLELLIQGFHIDIVAWLHAEELEIVNLPQ